MVLLDQSRCEAARFSISKSDDVEGDRTLVEIVSYLICGEAELGSAVSQKKHFGFLEFFDCLRLQVQIIGTVFVISVAGGLAKRQEGFWLSI